jgi:uncharacterized protein
MQNPADLRYDSIRSYSHNMNAFNSAFTLFLSLMVEAMPFLIIGVLFSGLLQYFVKEEWLLRWMPKNALLGALAGSLLGMLFPVCECGNVPVARRMLTKGLSPAVAIGFLLAAPTINPIVFWATWTAFRDQPEVVFYRIGLSLFIATTIAWIFSQQKDLRPFLQKNVAAVLTARQNYARVPEAVGLESVPSNPLLQSGTFMIGGGNLLEPEETLKDRTKLLLDTMVQELRELGGVLILGSAVAAIIQSFVPREVVLGLGQGSISSITAMMLLAGIVSICSTVDSFFALSFSSAFTTGSLIAFLVFGPMIDLKGIGLLGSVFRPRAIFYLFGLSALMTFLAALVLNLYVF